MHQETQVWSYQKCLIPRPSEACSLDSQSRSARWWVARLTIAQPQRPQILTKMVPSCKHASKPQKPTGWHQTLHAGFSTVYGLCSRSNFIYRLSGFCICWAKHLFRKWSFGILGPTTRTGTSRCHRATESFCSGSYAPSSAPQWDYDRSVRCQQELMNIPLHKAWVILPTKCPPHW